MTWMYHKTTGEAKLFKDESEITNDWCDSPKKCSVEEAEVIDRDALKEEAVRYGIKYAPNVKTDKLIELINEAKQSRSYVQQQSSSVVENIIMTAAVLEAISE